MNVFTPGYRVVDDPSANDCFLNEFDDDGIFTGNTTMGGTAFVHGSHRLSVSARLLSDDDDNGRTEHTVMADANNGADAAMIWKEMPQRYKTRKDINAGRDRERIFD